jgi:PEP-CTERM motif
MNNLLFEGIATGVAFGRSFLTQPTRASAPSLTAAVRTILVLGIVLGLAGPAYCDKTQSVQIKGCAVGTSIGPEGEGDKYDGMYTVTVVVNIKTKIVDGKTVFDTQNMTVTLRNTSPLGNSGATDIPVTDVQGDPKNQTVTSVTFKGTDWDTGGQGKATGIEGKVDMKNRTGTIEASNESLDKTSTASYTFSNNPNWQKPAAPKSQTADTSIPKTKSLDYDAKTGLLSIHGDSITKTSAAKDPVLGAGVSFPTFRFVGFNHDMTQAIFWHTDQTPYTIVKGDQVYERSNIPFLSFSLVDHTFYAPLSDTTLAGVAPTSPFYDPTLPNISSPFLNSLDDILNPSSPSFDSQSDHYLTITPDANFLALTDNFTSSASTGGFDAEFAARGVPEPSTLVLFAVGLCGLLALVRLSRQRHERTHGASVTR